MTNQNDEKLEQKGSCGRLLTPRRYGTVLGLIACAALPLSAATGQLVANTTPRYVSTAQNLGPADPSTTIDVSIWLNLRNRSMLDTLAGQLYNPSSPNYRHWLKPSDVSAKFAPTAQEAAAAQQFFVSHNLKIVTVGPGNLFVRAQGTVGDIEKAFQVQLNNYSVNGTTYRAPASDPYVDGPATGLVRAVSGLDSGGFSHPLALRPSTVPGQQSGSGALQYTASADFFTSNCFPGVTTQKYSTDGTFPTATYTGNGYFGSATNPSPGCGYTPSEMYTAYNLSGLYKEGYNGAGQTIAIIDWCGSPTIKQDANAFSTKFGLPMLTSSNFSITQVPTPSQCAGPDAEINLDVEWSHAVAPGANINLVVPPSNSFQDIDEAESYIIIFGLGTVISGSYGAPESEVAISEVNNQNLINEMAAMIGISANFSSADEGDFSIEGIPATVSAPADDIYATAVGGVSVALNPDNSIAWQAGWGTNEAFLVEPGFISNPPGSEGFVFGAGGGPSGVFPKPSFQTGVPGTMRQLPDISWVADPFTGVVILISEPGEIPTQVWEAIGGTSVACPMFSGLWAIANEEAGAALGQAAPYLYSMPAGAITDVVPVGSKNNVTAVIHDTNSSVTTFGAGQVLGGATEGKYYSALWDYPYEGGVAFVISFGTDCTAVIDGFGTLCTSSTALQTAVGWDNVTGMGTPNAQVFADSFKTP
jgi:subtilase family serine protease